MLDNVLCTYTGICSMLLDPTNGRVIVQGDTAFFVCLSGTIVMGNPVLTCINGTWSDSPPTCKILNSAG